MVSLSSAPGGVLRLLFAVIMMLALAMLAHLVEDLPIRLEITRTRLQPSELLSLVTEQRCAVVCLADLPPSLPSKTRYLVRRLRAALPDIRILIGRWAPLSLADESTQLLREAGADLVASTLSETRTYLSALSKNPDAGRVVDPAA